jgi:spoIIIJ-associated protein
MDDESEDYDQRDDTHAQAVSDEELTAMAVELLGNLVQHMGFDAQVNAAWHDADDNGERYLLLDIHGHDLSPLIGRRGETLASIQYLVRLMINQRIKRWKNVVVDVEQYKERRVNQLTQLAKRMADQVTQSGRAVSLEPMPANERRIVHLALRDHPSVYTQSSGEGERRKVHIVSKS